MKRGSNCRLGRYSGEFSGWSLMMTCGVHMSERGRGITGTGSGKAGMGRGLVPPSGPKGCPGPFSYFILFSPFLFLFPLFLL
jgi:hypothetical protein